MNELPHLPCPDCVCRYGERRGWIFQDARGGYECTECDGRFAIQRESPHGYGGPAGPLSWTDRNGVWIERAGWLAIGGAIGHPRVLASLGLFLIAAVCWLSLTRAVRR